MTTHTSDFTFEICANSPQSCEVAELVGAHRVELCAALTEGGTTPSYGTVKEARRICKRVKLNVIVRPRGGDFLYSPSELKVMLNDITMLKDLGVDGVVIGCLNEQGGLDEAAMEALVKHAGNLSITFHRAFDVCSDPSKVLEQLIQLGISRVLTSGTKANALEGASIIGRLNTQAAGRIQLMAGAGVNSSNIAKIYELSGVHEFHFSAKGTVRSGMKYYNPEVFMGLPNMDEYEKPITSEENARATIEALLKLKATQR